MSDKDVRLICQTQSLQIDFQRAFGTAEISTTTR